MPFTIHASRFSRFNFTLHLPTAITSFRSSLRFRSPLAQEKGSIRTFRRVRLTPAKSEHSVVKRNSSKLTGYQATAYLEK